MTQTNYLPGLAPQCGNPMIPGYYADPSLVQYGGRFYVYATLDPWGGETLGCWESEDFKNWTYRLLNCPTFAACSSPTGRGAKVWAPSVVPGGEGQFYMYVSVGNEIWAGVAAHPLGPWRNILGAEPFIHGEFRPGFHMIDAEAFIDDDGSAWLYWGSGWEWINGRCFAAKLGADMASFASEICDVTPENYFEAPFMVKRGGRYFLVYSSGRTDQDTYQVHYAVGEQPLGPFVEAPNSPILVTDHAANVLSPGHHAVFALGERDYIFYHRHSVPFDPNFIGHQLCVDELHFVDGGATGCIETVTPTHSGPPLVQRQRDDLAAHSTASASSQRGELFGASRVLENNYASRWAAAPDASGAWLQLDFGETVAFARQELRPEYAWQTCFFTLQSSHDGQSWQTLADFTGEGISGSPLVIEASGAARFLRIVFPESVPGAAISIFEWTVKP